ncbi:MAG: hypothetical protein ACI4U2_01080 [Christensenellaceae bacterium]
MSEGKRLLTALKRRTSSPFRGTIWRQDGKISPDEVIEEWRQRAASSQNHKGVHMEKGVPQGTSFLF